MTLDKDQIYIIENIISKKEQQDLLNDLLYTGQPDVYGFTTAKYHENYPPNIIPEYQWVNIKETKNHLLRTIEARFSIEIDKVIRVKTNWAFRKDISHENSMYAPHVDTREKCWNLIYYVIDSDGDTILFDQTLMDFADGAIPPKDLDKLSIKTSVPPQQGNAVLFWGDRFHAGKPPIKNDFRIIINHNFTIK